MKLLLVLATILAPALCARLPYIVGGQDASPGNWPWQASLQQFGGHMCGAAVISNRWLVTAAHCVTSAPAAYYTVVLGLHDRTTMLQGRPQTYTLNGIYMHPGWLGNQAGFPNDIAVMQLSTNADLSHQYASAISMASSNEDFVGNSNCWITGWGKLSGVQGPPNILQEANVDVYTRQQCAQRHGNVISDYHICVGKQGLSGGCQGDSGGPLACQSGGTWKLAGVTSWGRADCNVNYPSVYSRISYFRSWIQQMTGV